jgi:mRNA-degrading endonuclease RelE of RelBE toxin-antitoxin system
VPDIIVKQMPFFKKTYKKLHFKQKEKVDEAIRSIIKNPKIGQENKGNLTGIFVYKFKVHNQEILLAYEWSQEERLLFALGVHEKIYRDLKKMKPSKTFFSMAVKS